MSIPTLFRENGWFHRCVDLRAKSIQNMPWSITKSGSDNVLWDSDMPEVPKELQFASHLPRLLYMWESALVTVGKAYTLKESEGRSIDSLFYFNPLKVEPVKTSSEGIVAYKRTVNAGVETYPVEDIIALFHPDPFVENGPAAQSSAAKNAQVLRALDGFLVSFLDKGLIKATILSVEGAENVQPDQLTKLKNAWKKTIAGWFNGGEQQIFNSKVTPHTVGEGLGDLNNNKLTQEQREALCRALGIPVSLMMSNAANYATAELDHINFYVFTVVPESKFLMRELNRQLFSMLGYKFCFHPERLEVIQRYELDKAAKVVQVVGGPVLTQDEGRALLGYEPLGSMDLVETTPKEDEPQQLTEGDMGDEQKSIEAIVLRVLEERKPKEIKLEPQVTFDGSDLLYALDKDSRGVIDVPVVNHGISSKELDIKNWKRRIKKKDNRKVRFEPEHLNEYEAAVIRERLDTDMPLDEVFREPFVGF